VAFRIVAIKTEACITLTVVVVKVCFHLHTIYRRLKRIDWFVHPVEHMSVWLVQSFDASESQTCTSLGVLQQRDLYRPLV